MDSHSAKKNKEKSATDLEESLQVKQKRVLIIEDMSEMRTMLKALVTSLGYVHIDTEASGSAALKLILNKHYDIIFSDYNLGGAVNGQQILECARSTYADDHSTIFIMVSADIAYENVVGILEFQPDSYLVKPFTPASFKRRFEQVKTQKSVFDEINSARKNQNYAAMEKQAKEIMMEHPKYTSRCLQIIGESLCSQQRYKEAKKYYSAVLKNNSKTAWAYHALALCEIKLGSHKAATEHLIKAIELSRHFLSAYDLLAESQEKSGEHKSARDTMIKVIEISPYSIKRAENLARLSARIEDWEHAEKGYNLAIKLSYDTNKEKVERYYHHLQAITNLVESGIELPKLAEKFKRSLIRLRNLGKDNPIIITNSFRAEINQQLSRGYKKEALKSWKQWNSYIDKGHASPITDIQEKTIKKRLSLL